MSMQNVSYQGFGIDLGRLNKKNVIWSKNKNVNKLIQKVYKCFIDNIDTIAENMDTIFNHDNLTDISMHTTVNSYNFTALAIIENDYLVYDDNIKRNTLRTYTVTGAKEHLQNYFDDLIYTFLKLLNNPKKYHVYDLWFGANDENKITAQDLAKTQGIILKVGKKFIEDNADFDYNAGSWTDQI